ncbi:hypothetical protein [Spiroplasma endosymbiont of Virgichneumon dumeticola]
MNSFNFIVSSTSTCGEKSVIKLYIFNKYLWYKNNINLIIVFNSLF